MTTTIPIIFSQYIPRLAVSSPQQTEIQTEEAHTPTVSTPIFVQPATTPARWRDDTRFKALLPIAKNFYENANEYRNMATEGYNAVFGPIADVAPIDEQTREASFMWRSNRVHTWRPEIAAFFASLSISAANENGNRTIAFIKHAPGIGNVITKSIELEPQFVTDERRFEEVEHTFTVFEHLVRRFGQGVGVMVGGVIVPSLNQDSAVTSVVPPAALSPEAVSWMRRQLGQNTLLITDDAGSYPFEVYCEARAGNIPRHTSEFKIAKLAALLEQSVKADVDLILYYEGDYPDHVAKQFLEAGRRLIKEGRVTRSSLEKSVRRILLAKRNLYPTNENFGDIDSTIARMTGDELWTQKLTLNTYEFGASDEYFERSIQQAVRMGIGGLSIEACEQRLNTVKKAASNATIPIFIANNSRQELAGFDNPANPERLDVWRPIRAFTSLYDKLFPAGAPEAFFEELQAEVIQPRI